MHSVMIQNSYKIEMYLLAFQIIVKITEQKMDESIYAEIDMRLKNDVECTFNIVRC